jgi:hypothetical protein
LAKHRRASFRLREFHAYSADTPTPALYAVVAALILATVIVAAGFHALLAVIVAALISRVVLIASVGGFRSDEGFALGVAAHRSRPCKRPARLPA